jgi:hypothetical protein
MRFIYDILSQDFGVFEMIVELRGGFQVCHGE